jgi:hypothetical protein
MKTLGIHIAKSQLRYALLEGTKAKPILLAKKRLITVDPENVPALMDWFDTQFRSILDKLQPDTIGYRLTLEPKKEQLFTSEFPLGILNLLAHQRSIPITPYTAQNFVGSRLGLSKQTDLFSHCDSIFGENPPYWDKNQKCALLTAWFELP